MSGRTGAPFDPRLWPLARTFRWFAAGSVVAGLGLTVGLVAQAGFLAGAVAGAVARRPVHTVEAAVVGLAAATAGRAVLAFGAEQAATGAAVRLKTELRTDALRRLAAAPPDAGGPSTGDLATTLGPGLDALDGYVGRYLPRLVLAALAPVVLLVWVAHLDLLSAGILVVTLLLLPVFMILVGQLTRERVGERWEAITRLGGQWVDALEGMATLRAYGRARAQQESLAAGSDQLRRATMATLRVALLSALVLELLAAVGTALVAVPLALRLLSGRLPLAPALAVLVLAPEVYLPLRRASADFHASAAGAQALDAVAAIGGPVDPAAIGGPVEPAAERPRPSCSAPDPEPVTPGWPALRLRDVTVAYPGREGSALGPISLDVGPGERLGIAGESGAGKSTLIAVLAGLLLPAAGELVVDGRPLSDLRAWRRQLTWVAQRPVLLGGTVGAILRVAAPGAADAELWEALELAGLADLVGRLPGRLDGEVGERAERFSAGERQRLALARAWLRRPARLVLLDEPTAHLDAATEAAVVAGIDRAVGPRTAVVVSHRPAPLEIVDRVVRFPAGGVAGLPDRDFAAVSR